MTNSAASFDLEAYLSTYRPQLLSEEIWAVIGADVVAAVRSVGPTRRADARGLLGAVGRFLARMAAHRVPTLDLLTRDNIERFIELERLAGENDGTLGQVSLRLRRIENARAGRVGRQRTRSGPRAVPLNPYTDDDMAVLARLAEQRHQDGDDALMLLIELAEGRGARTAVLAARGLTSTAVAGLRDAVRNESEIRLRVHRLRHRWLLRVVCEGTPVAVIVRDNDLTRDDLKTVHAGLVATASGTAVIRSA
jgi:hypothetical protein